MARDSISVTALTLDAGTDLITGEAIDDSVDAAIDAEGNTDGLLIWVSNTDSAEWDVTIVAGTTQEAVRAGVGDLTYAVGAGEEAFIVIEGARFVQDDGEIYVNYEDGMTGFIAAYRLPDGA